MKELLWGIVAGLIILAPFALVLLVFVFTTVEEGSAEAVKFLGKFSRLLMTYEGFGFDQDWEIHPITDNGKEVDTLDVDIYPTGKKIVHIRPQILSKLFGGLRLVGVRFLHTIHWYNFRWSVLWQEVKGEVTAGKARGEAIAEKIVYREERINWILLKDAFYVTEVIEAEEAELVPINVRALITIRVINPYKALFRVHNWLEAVLDILKPAIRKYVSTKKYQELTRKDEYLERELDTYFEDVSKYIQRRYGVIVKKVGFISVNPGGELGKTYVQASTRKYEAEREAERIATMATAEAGRISTIRDAEVARFIAVTKAVKDGGEEGQLVFAGETIRKASEGPSTTVVLPFGKIMSFLRDMIGKEGK